MPDTPLKGPSRGRLFKLFTDIGPYFRTHHSNENEFFFDCLEVCIDAEKEPEERTFLGWWLLVKRSDNTFTYERFNGLYDLQGNWVKTKMTNQQLQQLDQSFEVFINKLKPLIEAEISVELVAI